ncbi:MAG: FHA domain-containing protein [Deltaproteobacteria bacterium]|nr:FHA domain-containing protein [Deltaproteobacteria bacterium]
MQVQLLTLEALRPDLARFGRRDFVEHYPGAFLLAMGFLSAEEIRAQRKRRDASGRDIDATTALRFAPTLRHEAGEAHPLAGCAFHLRPDHGNDPVSVGRAQSCNVTIPDAGVSERHCRIELRDDGVMVVDEHSTNGTTINLERLEAGQGRLLADEDILSVGRYSFQMLSAATFYVEIQPVAVDLLHDFPEDP